MLQYDDSAFYFFVLSTTACYVVPSWISLTSRAYKYCKDMNDPAIGAVARTSAEANRLEHTQREKSKKWTRLSHCSSPFIVNLVATLLFTVLFLWTLNSVLLQQDSHVGEAFDPFSTLGIDAGASIDAAKRRYRKLVLEWHPDHCHHGPLCVPQFQKITKAYEALTDPEARKNWEEYGNPDGKQPMEMLIDLPTFLLDPQFRNLVVLVYLICTVVVIPYVVLLYYSNSSIYGEKNVMYKTYSWYANALIDRTLDRHIQEIFAGSAEFRERLSQGMKTREQKRSIKLKQIQATMVKTKWDHPVLVRGATILQAYMIRKIDQLKDVELEELKDMLSRSSILIEAMIHVCMHKDYFQTALQCIDFSQRLTQAVSFEESPLLQLPHFKSENVQKCKEHGIKTVIELRRYLLDGGKNEDCTGIMVNLTKVQMSDVHKYLNSIYPQYTLAANVFVEDDDDGRVYEGDIATLEVSISREGEAGFVHAPYFPFLKKDAFWILFGDLNAGKIIRVEQVECNDQAVVHKIQFLAPSKGTYQFDLFVKSNGYIGADVHQKVVVTVLDKSDLPVYKPHKDDADLDEEPTLFELIMNGRIEEDSDDESDEEAVKFDTTRYANCNSSVLSKKKADLQMTRQSEEEEDDH